MPKNIVITATDGVSMGDESGEKSPRKEMIHDQVFREFGINPSGHRRIIGLKHLPKDWISEIIENNVNSIVSPKPDSINVNVQTRVIILGFDNIDNAKKFMKAFASNLFKSIARVIKEKGENPKQYDRSLILSDKVNGSDDGAIATISY